MDAIRDPAFRNGTRLLIDARLTKTRRTSEEFRERAIWMSSLKGRGVADCCALVISQEPHQFGVARMAATHVEMHGMELGIFTDIQEASMWLLKGDAATAASA